MLGYLHDGWPNIALRPIVYRRKQGFEVFAHIGCVLTCYLYK